MAINSNSIKALYDTTASLHVLSYLMHEPLLLQDDRYTLTKTDFDPKPIHSIVYYVIYNLAHKGLQTITPTDIDAQVQQYDAQYAYYQKQGGFTWINECYQITELEGNFDKSRFKIYYDRVKKFSVLRDLERQGVNTNRWYNPNKDALNKDLEDDKLDKISVSAILNDVRMELAEIEDKHVGKSSESSQDISKGMRQLFAQLKETPEIGLPLDGKIVNYTTSGAREGKMYIYSAPTGMGKSRYMVDNACAISMPYIDENCKIVARDDYQKVLFVATEMKADEIQTMVLAHVSGVKEDAILYGNCTEEQEKRIQLAFQIIDAYGKNFIVDCIPDPSIELIKARLTRFILQDDIHYIFYDYIFSSPGLLGEFRDVGVREDVALMMLSNTLKEIAMTYGVFVQSATQLNDGWSKKELGIRDQNMIRGSKAIIDKADCGIIGVKLVEGSPEWKQIEEIWSKIKYKEEFQGIKAPNLVLDIYKNRRGPMNFVKIFRYFDFATCRCKDLFITDQNYTPIRIENELVYNITKYTSLDEMVKQMQKEEE